MEVVCKHCKRKFKYIVENVDNTQKYDTKKSTKLYLH